MICISNPPYNMKWEYPDFVSFEPRFQGVELPPENNSNYAFILTALNEADKSSLILPNGVLTTENKQEKEIRKYLCNNNFIEAIVKCPDGMFEATQIPVCIIVLNKNKKTTKTMMVDMSKKCDVVIREQRGQFGSTSHTNRVYKKEVNEFNEEQINLCVETIKEKKEEKGFSKNASLEEIKNNDYNLSVNRYIEMPEEEDHSRSYEDIIADLNRVKKDKNMCKLTINENLARSLGLDKKLYEQSKENEIIIPKALGDFKIEKDNYISFTKNKNEFKFENTNKDELSDILTLILMSWRQRIHYLNCEENRYLAELRDKLLPDLMSGKIDVSDL